MNVIAEVIIELIGLLVGRREAKQGQIFWGARFIFLGIILTGFGSFLLMLSLTHGGVVPQMWCGILPFLIVGIPFLLVGIILKNNP